MVTRIRRAAIITLNGASNFGNRLQNYATQVSLEREGFDVETLQPLAFNIPAMVRGFFSRKREASPEVQAFIDARHSSFVQFERQIRTRRVRSRLHLIVMARHYDVFVFGSDQIWNPYHTSFRGREYGSFLSKRRNRISLAASFAVNELPEERKSFARKELMKFKSISVREFQGASIVHELINREAKVILDPTMSLTRAEWQEIASDRLVPDENYVLVYLLGDYDEGVWHDLDVYANNKKLKIVKMLQFSDPSTYAAGPQDFVGLIAGASHMFTDSFHAMVFSCLFGTKVSIIRRPGNHSMNSRFETLDQHFGFRYDSTEGVELARTLVFHEQAFQKRLEALRHEYAAYLREAIDLLDLERSSKAIGM